MSAQASAPVTLPSDAVLIGRRVKLEPLTWEHVPALLQIAYANPSEFKLTSTPTSDAEGKAYFGAALAQREAGVAHPVAVIDQDSRVVGTSRISEVNFRHRRCELGFSWYDPSLFRTGINVESKLLLLRFAFEKLQMVRVQIHTDTRNLRSQRAILALGARFEGVLKRHQIAKDGYVRDTMVFAITDLDWPDVQAHLEQRLARHLGQGADAA